MENPRPMTPGATLDFEWDFAAKGWLRTGDPITTHVPSPAPEMQVVSSTVVGGKVVAFLKMADGLAEGKETWCDMWISTQAGRTDKRRMRFVATLR
jgi:hypothetical protein